MWSEAPFELVRFDVFKEKGSIIYKQRIGISSLMRLRLLLILYYYSSACWCTCFARGCLGILEGFSATGGFEIDEIRALGSCVV